MNLVYNNRSGLYIGFHGCDEAIRDGLLRDPQSIKTSHNDYDWLGGGFYIWENNLDRALEWAKEKEKVGKIAKAAVIGVVYELGTCLDLTDSSCIKVLEEAYKSYMADVKATGKTIPTNKDVPRDENHDKLLRKLDCAVIDYTTISTDQCYLQDIEKNGFSAVKPYDSVRGCFTEGGKLFDTEIYAKTHIQVSIRNMNCIKGFFMPRKEISFPPKKKLAQNS